ncbi:MAG: DNA mismatch repair endonuclease MutL [Bacilli bacterium]|nr:DNA mismatch repair endonuclease MutL [Bacilli bacterium]
MGSIKVMNETLANKIAAGEVIEKCASIVKELVENSIDAGSTKIVVNLVSGGLKGIKVSDNGKGMDKDDAVLAFQRHATSKLYRDDDLFFINTLGFRGEALPSIASVSEVTLETTFNDEGFLVHIKGGKIIDKETCPATPGTRINVENIFYNTPARLKYLKSESTELQNCTSYIEKLALSMPKIAFELYNNDHNIIRTSGSGNLAKVIHELYGSTISTRLIKFNVSSDDFDIDGFICKPDILKSTRSHIITFVNNRVVKNIDINRAINDGYFLHKPDNKYPVVFLNIYTDPTLVDVNIHPTKQDIKISKINELCELLTSNIKIFLEKALLVPEINLETKEEDREIVVNSDFINTRNAFELVDNNNVDKNDDNEQVSFDFTVDEVDLSKDKNEDLKKLYLEPIGSIHGTFIVAQNDEGMYLIDQHAAHERVNYEKVLKALEEKDVHTMAMLFPISIELSPSEYLSLKDNIDIITGLGFVVEDFGINTIIFKETPTWLGEGHEEEVIRKIVDLIVSENKIVDRVKFNENLVRTIACKMSIKGNTPMSLEEMNSLIEQLFETNNPYNCAHGRPTIVKFSSYDLDKMFKRAMT